MIGSKARHCGMLVSAVAAVLMLLAAPPANAEDPPLELRVFTAGPGSLNVSSTLISGRSDAYRLVADILDTGRELKTIIVTHGHPDHYFSLDVFKDAFANVDVVAAPEVVEDIWAGFTGRLAYWGAELGDNAPRYPYVPRALEGTVVELEGQTIEILGPMQGDTGRSTAVYVPVLAALVAGDIVFNHVHVYTAGLDAEARARWIESLDNLLVLEPGVVVAGHTKENVPNTTAAIEYTRDYLERFERAIGEANDAGELITIMRRAYPEALDFDDFILSSSAASAIDEKRRRH